MTRRFIAVALTVIQIFLLSGCWNYTEIDQDVLVSGLAIDKGKDGYRYYVTAELVVISGGGAKPAMDTKTIESDGETIFEAARNLLETASKKVYVGHCLTVVISSELAKEGITDIIDVIVRDHELRLTMDVIIAKGQTAKEILSSESLTIPIVSYEIAQMLSSSDKTLNKSIKADVCEIVNTVSTPGIALMLPTVETVEVEDSTTFKIDGSAVFRDDKFIAFLSGDDTKNCNFVLNNVKGGTVLLKSPEKENASISFEIFRTDTSIDFEDSEKGPRFTVKVKQVIKVGNLTKGTDLAGYEGLDKLTKLVNEQVELDITKTIKKVQKEIGVDIFGFGKKIYEDDNKTWNKYSDKWDKMFPVLEVEVKVDAVIVGSGVAQNKVYGE